MFFKNKTEDPVGDQIQELQKTIIKLRQQIAERDEKINKLHGAVSSITKLIEEVVKKDEAVTMNAKELSLIFDASNDYVAVLDKEHKIRRVNRAFCTLVSINEPEEAIGKDFYTYFTDLPSDFDRDKIKREEFMETTYFSKKLNKWLLMRSRMLKQECDPLVYIHITKDVTKDAQTA